MQIVYFIEQNIFWVLLVILAVFVIITAYRANSAFDKYLEMREKHLKMPSSLNISAKTLGETLSNRHFGGLIKLGQMEKDGPDGSYIPKTQTVTIKEDLLENISIAAISVLAHEFGHAVQHFQNPEILIKHQKLNSLVKTLGNLNPLIVILSIVLCITLSYVFALVGLGVLGLNTIIAICLKAKITSVEKNASQEAVKLLEQNGFGETDLIAIKKFLSYAKNTYKADLVCALLGWTGLTRKTKYF